MMILGVRQGAWVRAARGHARVSAPVLGACFSVCVCFACVASGKEAQKGGAGRCCLHAAHASAAPQTPRWPLPRLGSTMTLSVRRSASWRARASCQRPSSFQTAWRTLKTAACSPATPHRRCLAGWCARAGGGRGGGRGAGSAPRGRTRKRRGAGAAGRAQSSNPLTCARHPPTTPITSSPQIPNM